MSLLEFVTQYGKIDTKAIVSLDVDTMVNAMRAFWPKRADTGPPGWRKSMLAQRLTTSLPVMSLAEALEPRVSTVSPHRPAARSLPQVCLGPLYPSCLSLA